MIGLAVKLTGQWMVAPLSGSRIARAALGAGKLP
jgi:hypothetical protein